MSLPLYIYSIKICRAFVVISGGKTTYIMLLAYLRAPLWLSSKVFKYMLHELNMNLCAGIWQPSVVHSTTSVNFSERYKAATEPLRWFVCECHLSW